MRWRWVIDEADDPSVFVRLPLVDTPGTSLLVWTTTPWTLPANVAVAAGPDVDYVTVERQLPEGGTEKLDPGEALVAKMFGDEAGQESLTASRANTEGEALPARCSPLCRPEKPAHYVVLGDFVTTEDGTGLVHIAPAFGADDMQVALEHDLPIVMTVAEDGTFIPEVRPGRHVCQRCRSAHHPGPARTRAALQAGDDTPHLSVLLALLNSVAVLCPPNLVYPHQPVSKTGWWSSMTRSTGIPEHIRNRRVWQLA